MRSLNDKHRRDLELILLGVAISKPGENSRAKVLDELPQGSFTKEIEPLINAVRSNKPEEIASWFAEREIIPEKGECFIGALTKGVDNDNRSKTITDVCRSLGFASRLESAEELIDRLKRAVKQLESL